MTRYSRRREDGVVEYHDNEEALQQAALDEEQEGRAVLFAGLGLLIGGILGYVVAMALGGAAWPRWARFACVIAGAAVTAFALARLANLIVMVLQLLIAGLVITGIVMIIWSAV